MEIDQNKAVKIFTQRQESEQTLIEQLRPDLVIEHLISYRDALIIYLEYIVLNKNIMVSYLFGVIIDFHILPIKILI
jgi:hypothetical protein